jgi:hypothetical protein
MKKTLSFLFSTLFFLASVSPAVTYAAVGASCGPGFPACASNEYCHPVDGSCYLSSTGGTTGGGGSGGFNTTRIGQMVADVIGFINFVLVPLLIAVAFIVFLWGVYKYFIYGGDSDDKRSEGKTFVMYGVIGFVIIFSLWGLVNVGVSVLGLGTGGRGQTNLPYPTI